MNDKPKPKLNKKQHEALATIRSKLTTFRRKIPNEGATLGVAIHLEAASKSLDNAVNEALHGEEHH